MVITYISSLEVYDMWYLQGCVVPTRASMEANVQRLLTRYATVHRALKEHSANMVSFLSNMIKKKACRVYECAYSSISSHSGCYILQRTVRHLLKTTCC